MTAQFPFSVFGNSHSLDYLAERKPQGRAETGINGKVVVVTGAGRGIGRAVSRLFAREKAKVIIAEIDERSGKENETYIKEHLKGDVHYIHTDVSSEESVKHLVSETVRIYGGVDILINNAGTGLPGNIFDANAVATFDKVIGINLRGTYMCSKYCAEHMRNKNKGVIINIASTRAFQSEPNTEPYSASKGAIIGLTHSMAISLGKIGIRVNSISPGWIDVSETPSELTHLDHEQHPVGRVGTPEDVAHACLYLSSDVASFITAENLVIDGGMSKKMIYV